MAVAMHVIHAHVQQCKFLKFHWMTELDNNICAYGRILDSSGIAIA